MVVESDSVQLLHQRCIFIMQLTLQLTLGSLRELESNKDETHFLINVMLWILGGTLFTVCLQECAVVHNEIVWRALMVVLLLMKMICLFTAFCEQPKLDMHS